MMTLTSRGLEKSNALRLIRHRFLRRISNLGHFKKSLCSGYDDSAIHSEAQRLIQTELKPETLPMS